MSLIDSALMKANLNMETMGPARAYCHALQDEYVLQKIFFPLLFSLVELILRRVDYFFAMSSLSKRLRPSKGRSLYITQSIDLW